MYKTLFEGSFILDKSVFEKYIEEMKAMKASAMPEPIPVAVPKSYPNSDNMEGSGELIVRVTSVRGLYPVKNAKVTVFTGDSDNMTIIAEGTTDQSGASPKFTLPAPAASFTESPGPASRPYALYNILTVSDGFRENYNYNAVIFDKITSLQTVELIPLTDDPELNGAIIIDEYEEYPL